MKKTLTHILVLNWILMVSVFAAEVKPKYGPKDKPLAIPLGVSHSYFLSNNHPAPGFWSLIGYYVPQMNGYSCSAASVAMVLNAARLRQAKTADDKVISQTELLDKVTDEQWKQRLSVAGAAGQHGLDLDRLGKVVAASFKAYGFDSAQVSVTHIDDTSAATKKEVLRVLQENEKSDRSFIISNFNQQAFTDDADAGHIAPIGAFDSKEGRVLVLDPDREYYEPYWISVDTWMAGMATLDKGATKKRGFVWVKLGKK